MLRLVSVINMSWTNQQLAFAVETYFRKNERVWFIILPRQAMPYQKSIILWVKKL